MHRNPATTQAYQTYYENVIAGKHNNTDFIARWGTDPGRFETQIVCHKMGTPVPDSQQYEQNGERFGPHRWPYNSDTEPNYSDPPIRYQIGTRLKAIGTSWWDWKNKLSIGLGFDFDSLIDHGSSVGIPQSEIDKLDQIDLPWIEIIRSTRGNGRHVYIWFDPENAPITQNHVEHSALARSFLPLLSQGMGMDVDTNVDCKGLIMWIYHVAMTKENRGYELIKPATQILTAEHVPPNWRDNIEVVSGGRSKVRVQGWTPDGSPTKGDELDEMTQAYAQVDLDETHLKILEALEGTEHTSVWVHDHHLFQGHTAALKMVFDDFAEKGTPLRGLFDTDSMDTDPGKPNCLSGDTKVITREGVKAIGELAGKDIEIITARGKWTTAPFKSYGEQEVFTVTIENRNQSKVIKATGDHRWYVTKYRSDGKRKTKVNFGDREQVVTKDLTEGSILVQTKPRCNHTPSVVGIQHGLVWGDGTNGGTRTTSQLSLFGEKDLQLLKYFAEHPQRTINQSVGGVEVWNLPHHFKSLVPLNYDKAYLYGWLAGYFAADGCVSSSGACIIRSTDEQSIKHVRNVCHVLGIETSKVTSTLSSGYKESMVYTTMLKAADLTASFFLIKKHKDRWCKTTNRQHHYWRVVNVEPAGREEVFCCTVEDTGCFCLEDFILIGNCFMRPKPNGGWDVYRFGDSTGECPLWNTQGKFTHTTFNLPPTLRQVCMACGAFEGPDERKGFLFESVEQLEQAIAMLGSKLKLPKESTKVEIKGRELCLRLVGSKIVATIEKKRSDETDYFPRWSKGSGVWERWLDDVNETSDAQINDDKLLTELDGILRSLEVETPQGRKFDSWAIFNTSWSIHPRENVKSFLASEGHVKPEPILGKAISKSWILVNQPFGPEYPGGRMWNRDAAQFAYPPVELNEGEEPQHPTWNRLLEHCGVELNEYIPALPWCKTWGINSGGDYLLAWLACMIQNPWCKLPYLFMYGPQNCGKSSFHEAISLILTRGVTKADRALTSSGGFNGELDNAILAVVDEVDITKAGSSVYNKLKEWVTCDNISIHCKGRQVVDTISTLHFVQMSNDRSSLPVFPGDTRITAMNVPFLEAEIPRDEFRRLLKEEAPHFLRTLLDFEMQEPEGRLAVPIIETQGKVDAAESNTDDLAQFLADSCYNIPGAAVKFSSFADTFRASLDDHLRSDYPNRKIKQRLMELYPVGRGSGKFKQLIIGNISLSPDTLPSSRYVKDGVNLRKEDD